MTDNINKTYEVDQVISKIGFSEEKLDNCQKGLLSTDVSQTCDEQIPNIPKRERFNKNDYYIQKSKEIQEQKKKERGRLMRRTKKSFQNNYITLRINSVIANVLVPSSRKLFYNELSGFAKVFKTIMELEKKKQSKKPKGFNQISQTKKTSKIPKIISENNKKLVCCLNKSYKTKKQALQLPLLKPSNIQTKKPNKGVSPILSLNKQRNQRGKRSIQSQDN